MHPPPQTTVLGGAHYSDELVARLCAATEAAAAASREWMGKGDKNAADAAAVAAMRVVLAQAAFEGVVVIGEGEKDDAPMLANGERLGNGGPPCDIAVDPLDGTRLVAEGMPGAVCVIAVAPRGSMLDPADTFYMNKLVAGRLGRGVLDIRRPIAENLEALARSTGVAANDLTVAVLDKPRHLELIRDVRAAGATVQLVGEGDVAVAVAAASPGSGIDLAVGIGGSPEGIIAACAVRSLGGFMQATLAAGPVLELGDLVSSDRVLFVSTEVS